MPHRRMNGNWKASDVQDMLENGEGPLVEMFEKILDLLAKEQNRNFILGKVIIENDLLEEDEKEEEETD